MNPAVCSLPPTRPVWVHDSSAYLGLVPLEPASRADVLVGVKRGAASLDHLIVIKRFHAQPLSPHWLQLVTELELAMQLQHPHVTRTLAIGFEAGRYFAISEYVEGVTLQACLDWAAARRVRFSAATVLQVLAALAAAFSAARATANSLLVPELAAAPVAADDLLITHEGDLRLLGFKSEHGRGRALESRAPEAARALLERHYTPELKELLPQLRSLAQGALGRSEGQSGDAARAELACWAERIGRRARARRALQLARAFRQLQGPVLARWCRQRPEEAPPQSGYRRLGEERFRRHVS